jgi:hypothetical protein
VQCIGGRLIELHVSPARPSACSYCIHYGNGTYCTCPVRTAIYREYGV